MEDPWRVTPPPSGASAVGDQAGSRVGTPEPEFTFVQISDVHVGNPENVPRHGRLVRAVELINELSPTFVIDTGDVATHPVYRRRGVNLAELAEYRRYVSGIECPVYVIPGNHDIGYSKPQRTRWGRSQRWGYHRKLAEYFAQNVGPLDQWFDYNGFRFILLNNNPQRTKQPAWISHDQLRRLQRLLKLGRPAFLFLHVNLFWRGDQYLWGWAARQITRLCSDYPVVLVAYGHSHDLRIRVHDDTPYLMAPDLKVPGHNSVLQYRVLRDTVEVWKWDLGSDTSSLVLRVAVKRA